MTGVQTCALPIYRFRKDMGGVAEAYQEVAQRLGILPESGPRDMPGPKVMQ